jgi:hypothetical protein
MNTHAAFAKLINPLNTEWQHTVHSDDWPRIRTLRAKVEKRLVKVLAANRNTERPPDCLVYDAILDVITSEATVLSRDEHLTRSQRERRKYNLINYRPDLIVLGHPDAEWLESDALARIVAEFAG